MGSATREAIAAASALLRTQNTADLATGEQLLAAAIVVGRETRLRMALADDAASAADRTAIVGAVFAKYTHEARAILGSLATSRWSSAEDLVDGIERLGIEAVASSAAGSVSISDELFALSTAVSSSSELELAFGKKSGSVEEKIALLGTLLEGKASRQTILIVNALLAQPRGRRMAELLRFASTIVAEQAGFSIATVTVAHPLTPEQGVRLEHALSSRRGNSIRINQVIDPGVLGGMRVQIGDEVIDGTIANRLTDLRLRLAS